jgi:biopolymer transport protein ExbB
MGLSIYELWATMGWFAKGIVVVLFLMSVFVGTIAIRKSLQLSRASRATKRFSALFSEALQREDFNAAEKLTAEHKHSHLAKVFERVFPMLHLHFRDRSLSAVEIDTVERTVELNALALMADYRRGLGVLATVGATAPFVGLLGTTMGIVNAFTGMATSGTGGLAAISAGIAEALITTAFGLLVAIPAVWLYNYYINRIDYLSMEITYATKELIDFLLRHEVKLKRPEAVHA